MTEQQPDQDYHTRVPRGYRYIQYRNDRPYLVRDGFVVDIGRYIIDQRPIADRIIEFTQAMRIPLQPWQIRLLQAMFDEGDQ